MVTPAEILTAVREGDTAAIEAWFETGTPDVDETIREGSFLSFAAIHDRCDVMISLLERGASVNAEDYLGCTPLHEAALSGKLDAAVLLLTAVPRSMPVIYLVVRRSLGPLRSAAAT